MSGWREAFDKGLAARARRLGVVHPHQLLGIGIRQRFQQHAVENAEHRGRHTDPEGKRDDGESADERGTNAGAQRVPDVLEHT